MERLTEWSYLAGIMTGGLKAGVDERKAFDRLAAYEDFTERWRLRNIEEADRIFQRVNALGGTDLMAQYRDLGPIDHLHELARAEKDGRLVVLPCKLHELIYYFEDGEWFDDVPYEVSIGQKQGEWNDSLLYECEGGFCFYAEDIGKTVFLTRKEAEAALKKREKEDNEAD